MKQKPEFTAHDRFDAAMKALGLDVPAPRIAVGVSGGGDSLALALLLQTWAEPRKGTVLAFTVDHGLRPGSAEEAEKTGALLKARGLTHRILRWTGDKPLTHIQERARAARYGLLRAACREENIPVLAVAHNAEDQVETFWMRLAKGSGLDGLTAMAPKRQLGNDGDPLLPGAERPLLLVRPLLSFSRADLRAVCAGYGVEWIDDPSNVNEQFLRVKLRQFEQLLEGEGLTPQRLGIVLQKLEDAREALQAGTDDLLGRAAVFHDAGYAVLDRRLWQAAPVELQRRCLSRLLQTVAPQTYAAGSEALEQTRQQLQDAGFAGKTLAGCELFPGRDDSVVICREAGATPPRETLRDGMIWDGRFRVSGYLRDGEIAASPGALSIGILGEAGLAVLRKKLPPNSAVLKELEALPFKVKKTLPALWEGENPVSVPCLNWAEPLAKETRIVLLKTLPSEAIEAAPPGYPSVNID